MIDVKVNWLKEIDSTNSEAHRRRHEATDFTVWAAEFQTAGRGQRGNTWESAVGENLTFSILFKPSNFLSTRQFELSQVVALGVVGYLATHGIEAKLKCPNDIYVGDKKICGILIENVLSGATLSVCIAGIGINLNQKIFRSDAPNPTSVLIELERLHNGNGEDTTTTAPRSCQESTVRLDPRQELLILIQEIAGLYYPLTAPTISDQVTPNPAASVTPYTATSATPDPVTSVTPDPVRVSHPTLEERYLSHLYRLNELHTYVDLTTGETFRGYIRGVEKNACLRIETETGEIKSFAFKELKYIISQ